jgi:CheY-like chemotaxis protein
MPLDDPESPPILVVEDNEVNALIIRAMLRRRGYSSLVACNGHEGVEMSRQHRPRLVLMDLQMPLLDGFGAASAIRVAFAGDAPAIVAVTANPAQDVRRACREAGFAAVIAKPIMFDELIATVDRHLARDDR